MIPVHPLRVSASACECVCGFSARFPCARLCVSGCVWYVCGSCVQLAMFSVFFVFCVCRCPRAYIILCRCLSRSVQPARIHLDVFVDVCMHVHV